jgi:hypothetical protein
MAKRWLTAKRLKQKTYRAKARGVLKRFSSERINVGMPPNPEVMQWYKNAANSLKHTHFPVKELIFHNSNQPRKEAMERKRELENACPAWMYFVLVDDAWCRARMYFHLNPERACIVSFSPRSGLSIRSVVYKSKDRAYQRWCSDTVDWSETFYHPNIPETFTPA